MAVAPRLLSLAGKWQVPLLLVSVGLFVAGLIRLRPEIPKITFDDRLREARVAMQAERYVTASDLLTGILNGEDDLTDAQRAAAHRMLAETIYLVECSRTIHDSELARRILSNYAIAENLGDLGQESDYYKQAQAADWLGDPEAALASYEKALDKEGVDRLKILQRMVEILLGQPKRDWPKIDSYVDMLLSEAADTPEVLMRAVQWKMQRLLAENRIEPAKELIHRVEARLDVPPWSYHLRYFQAQILYREGQNEAAEGILRSLQANLRRGNMLYAQAGWLLGQINYVEGRPQIALSFYDEIARSHPDNEYGLASLLGKAESLAMLERYAAAAESYQRVIETIKRSAGSMLLDEGAICTSLRSLAAGLSQQGRPSEALPFVQTAEQLVPEKEQDLLATMLDLEAKIRVQAADELLREAARLQAKPVDEQSDAMSIESILAAASQSTASRPATTQSATSRPVGEDLRLRARDHFVAAGELYARFAKIHVLDEVLAENADWESAICFERSGRLNRTIEGYELYISKHPGNTRTPEAMQRLGRAEQAAGKTEDAIATYQGLINKFSRTPPALASLVPLARCHEARGVKGYDRAEEILLSIVEGGPNKAELFEPAAVEFHEALIELANLYKRWNKPERAIERLEQALALYPNDAENTRLEYQLADAYRNSGLALRKDANASKQPTQRDEWMREANRRLNRAHDLFDRVAGRLDNSGRTLSPAEQAYLKTSYVYRADCAFDIGQYTEAADLYGRVAWRWQNDPAALSAYVQIVRSYMAAGDLEAARSALARARWILRRIPESQFNQPPDYRTRGYWTQLFDWVEQTGLLSG